MRMINRFFRVIVLLAITMTLSWTSVAAAVSEDGFKDVDENDAHYEGIMALSGQGIINGYEDGTFQQWGELSRQHAAVVLYKLLNQRTTMENDLDVDKVLDQYDDVDANSRYAHEIAFVTYAGIFNGHKNKFMPHKALSREELATILVTTFNLSEHDVDKQVRINLDNVNPSHKSSVQTLANLGFTNQLDDYRPQEATTRGSYATMLHLVQTLLEEEYDDDGNKIQ